MAVVNDFKRSDSERVSREQAAERLIDVAHALTAGGPLELTLERERLSVPLGADVRLERGLKASGDCVELELDLTWSTAAASPPAAVDQASPAAPPGRRPDDEG
jgi:amphi-Trp domain-containing protein